MEVQISQVNLNAIWGFPSKEFLPVFSEKVQG